MKENEINYFKYIYFFYFYRKIVDKFPVPSDQKNRHQTNLQLKCSFTGWDQDYGSLAAHRAAAFERKIDNQIVSFS